MNNIVHTVLLIGILLAAAGTLGVSIAILVNVLNGSTNNNNNQIIDTFQGASLNVPRPVNIGTANPKYEAYKSVAEMFNKIINVSVNPCDDFYAYTCGNFNGEMSFDVSDFSNLRDMVSILTDDNYISSAPLPVQQTRWYFDACVAARQTWSSLVADGSQVTTAINTLAAGAARYESYTQFPFPMLDQATTVSTFPNRFGIGYLAGALSAQGIDTIVSPGIDTNWKDPFGPDGFAYLIDQPTTFKANTFYRKAWNSTKVELFNKINTTMHILANVQNKKLDQNILTKDINDIIQFDYLLATVFSTDDKTRRNYERSYNPNTMAQLRANYFDSIFSWHMFIPLATGAAEEALQKLLGPDFQYYVVLESQKLQLLLSNLQANNSYQITPRQLVNYFYYRLVDANREFLPSANTIELSQPITVIHKPQIGRRRHIEINERKYRREQINDVSEAQNSCASETIGQMQWANARLFIDKLYPTNESRRAVREHVAKLASSIVIGFRSMIDQLDWMTRSTKVGAYNKIENLVKNIAYPDWITDDSALTKFYARMSFKKTDGYIDMLKNANNFNLYSNWIQLMQGPADRTAFNGPPGVTNAWYQPELNSITFPAGILKRPFYDFNWPASVNFGAMGVIAGHELTHGFDDEGVQWNGVGKLSGWMDDKSRHDFIQMASCVVDEYSSFCPLNKTTYGAASCIDGAQTQGENIADNGGIHSAFRAYKNYVDLYGPDALLPDDKLQYFSADQLFFLSFAQVWCQPTPSDSAFLRQLLVDVHSPSIYRVWGTIQNFPAFKTAFNCPVSNYAPEKHCNVWVSDVDTTFGLPNVNTDLNIVPEDQITSENVEKYNAYQSAVDYFSKAVNPSFDPCDDFFAYACGSFNQPVSFTTARNQNLIYMSEQLQNPNYNSTIQNVTAIRKEKQFFDSCLSAFQTSNSSDQLLIRKNYIQTKIETLRKFLAQPFSILNGGNVALPNATQLADALGFLSFEQGIDTFITPLVDTYWIDNSKGYQLFIDQNTAFLPNTYYSPNAWKIEQPKYLDTVYDAVSRYAIEEKISINKTVLRQKLSDVINFEQSIVLAYTTDDEIRRQYNRSWNLRNLQSLNSQFSFLDWNAYLAHVPSVVRQKVTDQNYASSVMEIDRLTSFSNDFNTFNPDHFVNLLYIRLLLGNAQYIPSYADAFTHLSEPSPILGLSRRKSINNLYWPSVQLDDASTHGPACAKYANDLMQFVNGRVFIDYLYPSETDIKNIRELAGGVIANVITSFQGMIDQLDWMDPITKKKAYDKAVNVQQNIAFPDWIKNDKELNDYYEPLKFDANDNFYDMYDKLIKFNIFLQYNQLTFNKANRNDFLGQPGTVNAWYQPELNSITFPAGILVPPYFNPKWPPSINYGGIGLIAGHELTHGFDDEGIQWDLIGDLNKWMDDNSTAQFTNMASCVVNEYNNFCPLANTDYSPKCVNGSRTQGENIADNGGVHAAFRAYKTHQALDGPDPRLPDRLFGQFTHDQLFFLNFAQVWCETQRSNEDLYKQIMTDPHSPPKYRVIGTIQNFPAFQTAFNCKLGSKSAPQNHCKVWVPGSYQ